MNHILDYLEETAKRVPDKTAVVDETGSCTYTAFVRRAREIGTLLAKRDCMRKPVVVFSEKSIPVLQAFMGIVYAGGFYCLVNPEFPVERIAQILTVLSPEVILAETKYMDKLKETDYPSEVLKMDEFPEKMEVQEDLLMEIRERHIDTDPLYCIFTSGSTGVPKGVLISHRSVIDFIGEFTKTFEIQEQDVLGNQAPFDFDVSVKDIYSCFFTGATLVLIPKSYFMFPNAVIDMLENNGVTTLIWAVSALCLLNRLHGLKYKVPGKIKKIMFSGEMMPIKQLNQWRAYYPDAMFVNLYGPTEITCNCTYHILKKEYAEDEKLPIGSAFANEKVFLLDADNKEVTESNIPGEICVAGTTLALGYYGNQAVTEKVFVQNPLQNAYPEKIYRTGDLAFYGEEGLLYFAGRKDFQIKHMGHRIELEEIETVLENVTDVEHGCCFFDERKNRIVAYYIGPEDKNAIIGEMRKKVPDYMIPNVFMRVENIPLNKNGKTDRKKLKEQYQEERYGNK